MNEAEKRQNEYINQTAERVENRYDFKKAEKDAYRLKKRSHAKNRRRIIC